MIVFTTVLTSRSKPPSPLLTMLEQRHVNCLGLAAALANAFIKAHALTLIKSLEFLVTIRDMDEDILTTVFACDKSKSLFIIVKFH